MYLEAQDKINHNMNWNNVTLKQWTDIEEIFRTEYEDDILKTADVIKVLFGIEEPMELTPQEFSKKVDEMKFLKEQIPDKKLATSYTLNGTKYNFRGNITECTMGQLMDWRQYSSKTPLDYAECLSVFMIPDGHKYNDGYDMEQTISDIGTLPIGDALKVHSFFLAAQVLFTETLTNYFKRQLKKTNLPKAKKEEIMNKVKEIQEINGTFSRMHLHTVK